MVWKKRFAWIGRCTFFDIYVVQVGFLAKYISDLYNPKMAAIVVCLLPGIFLWLGLVIRYKRTEKRSITHLWIVWSLYTFGFVVTVACIFAKEVEKLDKSNFFGPNVLKTTLCLAPLLLLLLLNTTVSATKNPKLIERISMAIALDLFDGIEMLDVLLLQGSELTVDKAMKYAMLSSVCLGFLLSAMALCQHKFDLPREKVKSRRKVTFFHAVFRVCLVDLVSLVLRLILLFSNGFSASIFITKNIISIVFCATKTVFVCTEKNTSENFVGISSLSRLTYTGHPRTLGFATTTARN